MPIGKDSITKRVAKVETPAVEAEEKNIAPELVATTVAAPQKSPAKKTGTTTNSTAAKSTAAKKTASTTAKKAPAKKPASEKPKADINTSVLSNVAPETVEAVIGHKEDEKYEKVQIGSKLPSFLL